MHDKYSIEVYNICSFTPAMRVCKISHVKARKNEVLHAFYFDKYPKIL